MTSKRSGRWLIVLVWLTLILWADLQFLGFFDQGKPTLVFRHSEETSGLAEPLTILFLGVLEVLTILVVVYTYLVMDSNRD